MIKAMQVIVDAVREVSPKKDVEIMSLPPDTYCVEVRDWTRLFDIMVADRINRIHLPQYLKPRAKTLYDFNRMCEVY